MIFRWENAMKVIICVVVSCAVSCVPSTMVSEPAKGNFVSPVAGKKLLENKVIIKESNISGERSFFTLSLQNITSDPLYLTVAVQFFGKNEAPIIINAKEEIARIGSQEVKSFKFTIPEEVKNLVETVKIRLSDIEKQKFLTAKESVKAQVKVPLGAYPNIKIHSYPDLRPIMYGHPYDTEPKTVAWYDENGMIKISIRIDIVREDFETDKEDLSFLTLRESTAFNLTYSKEKQDEPSLIRIKTEEKDYFVKARPLVSGLSTIIALDNTGDDIWIKKLIGAIQVGRAQIDKTYTTRRAIIDPTITCQEVTRPNVPTPMTIINPNNTASIGVDFFPPPDVQLSETRVNVDPRTKKTIEMTAMTPGPKAIPYIVYRVSRAGVLDADSGHYVGGELNLNTRQFSPPAIIEVADESVAVDLGRGTPPIMPTRDKDNRYVIPLDPLAKIAVWAGATFVARNRNTAETVQFIPQRVTGEPNYNSDPNNGLVVVNLFRLTEGVGAPLIACLNIDPCLVSQALWVAGWAGLCYAGSNTPANGLAAMGCALVWFLGEKALGEVHKHKPSPPSSTPSYPSWPDWPEWVKKRQFKEPLPRPPGVGEAWMPPPGSLPLHPPQEGLGTQPYP